MAETPKRDGEGGEALLEAAFAAARAEAGQPAPAALMARIEADALAAQASPAPAAGPARRGILRDLIAALGGWPALGGLATATVAGFWLGFAPPAGLGLDALWQEEDADGLALLLPDDYALGFEEG